MACNHLEEKLNIIRTQKAIYKKKIRELEKEEIEILEVLEVFKKGETKLPNDLEVEE